MISNAPAITGLDFAYVLADSSVQLDGDRPSVRMRRVDHTKFLPTSRGYHRVNEHPFNR